MLPYIWVNFSSSRLAVSRLYVLLLIIINLSYNFLIFFCPVHYIFFPDAASGNANATSGLKIAYVEVDTLLSQYNFCKDLNADMISKEENSRMVLNQKANELRKSQQEFQKKYESNAFISPERAQQEYARLGKLEQDLQALQNKLATEMASENAKNSQILRDSINAFLKEYNKTKGYNLIISNTSFDNLLYADSTLNITKEIVDGLNARYTPVAKK